MADLAHRFDTQDASIKGIRGDMLVQATAAQSMQKDLIRIDANVSLLLEAMGAEKEDGAGNYLGTGILGRVRRVERSQRELRELYHRWIAFGSGFCACLGGSVLIIWWLLGDKLAIVLKGTGVIH